MRPPHAARRAGRRGRRPARGTAASTLALVALARSEQTPQPFRAQAAALAYRRGALRAERLRRLLAARQRHQRQSRRIVQRVRPGPQLPRKRKLHRQRIVVARRRRAGARRTARGGHRARVPGVGRVLLAREFERQVRRGAVPADSGAIGAQAQEERRRRIARIGVASARARFIAPPAREFGLRCVLRDLHIGARARRTRRHDRELLRCAHLAQGFEAFARGFGRIAARRLAAREQHAPRQALRSRRFVDRRQAIEQRGQELRIAAVPEIRCERAFGPCQGAYRPGVQIADLRLLDRRSGLRRRRKRGQRGECGKRQSAGNHKLSP